MNMDAINPYVGLRPFDVDESILFFGRNQQSLELLERLHLYHFVSVVGNSGTGKSSLLRAGLIPSLKAGYLINNSDRWFIAIMKPGQNPLYHLAESILLQIDPKTDNQTIAFTVKKIEEEGVDALLNIVAPLWREKQINFFLLVDQFEELFRFAIEQNDVSQKDEAIDFVNIMLELSQQSVVPFYVVITMRSDFIGDCTQFYGLPEAMNQSQYLVPRITRSQLKVVIEGPAKLHGGKIDPILTSHLINELGKVSDELPLLQHALMRMWDFKVFTNNKAELYIEDYKNIGGIEKALSNHAEEALAGMDADELLLTKKIFQALTAIDTNGRKIRRPILLSQLLIITGAGKDRILKIIELFIKDKRSFIVMDKADDGVDYIIDISHESLIRQWHKLSKWVDEEGESATSYIQLYQATILNKQNKKDFLSGSELQNTLGWFNNFKPIATWADRYKKGFTESIEYLKKSEDAEKAKRLIEKKKRRKQNYSVVVIMVLLMLVAIGSFIATIASNKLKKQTIDQYDAFLIHARAQENIDNDPTLALRLEQAALQKLNTAIIQQAAWKIYRENSFYRNIQRNTGSVFSVAFSPGGGSKILTGSKDSTARLWDFTGHLLQQFKGHFGYVNTVAFSPDGKLVLTGSSDKTARLWNMKGGSLQVFKGHTLDVNAVAFSPDGKTIVTASSDGTSLLWDLQGNVLQQFKGHLGSVNSVAFSHDGQSVLTGSSDKTAQLWDLTGKSLQTFAGHSNSVNAVAFSPDGKTVLTGSSDKTARLWNLQGTMLREFKGHSADIFAVAFSPDGKKILTGSDDKMIFLWNLEGNSIQQFKGHAGRIWSVAFSPNRKAIISGSSDEMALMWDLKGGALQDFKGHLNRISAVNFSPDGKTVLTASWDKTARLWDLEGNIITEFKGHSADVYAAAFSPDGKTVLTGSGDKTARLWDLEGKTLQEFKGHLSDVYAVAFSPDGKKVLTGSSDKTARLWSITGELLKEFKHHAGIVYSVAFSPDGKNILTGSLDSTACLWDLDGAVLKEFKGHSGSIVSVSFSPDGKTVLTGSTDKTARLWKLNGAMITEFKGHAGIVNSAVFSPDGKTVLTGSWDEAAFLWDLNGYLLQTFKNNGEGVSSVAFSQDGKKILTGSLAGTAVCWRVPMAMDDFLKTDMIEPLSAEQKSQFKIK